MFEKFAFYLDFIQLVCKIDTLIYFVFCYVDSI